MFQGARIKLTTYYITIIMVISILFSFLIYQTQIHEIDRSLQLQRNRILRLDATLQPFYSQLLLEAKKRLSLQLFTINLGVLIAAGGASYFLAGKTLAPIEDMLEEQKRFVSDASHELRTPLTVLKTETEVALREKALTEKQAKKILRSNLEELDRLEELANSLLYLAKFEQGSNSLVFANSSIKKLLGASIKKIRPLANEKQITIKASLVEASVFADSESLERLFVILLDNAVKYSPEGSQIKIESKKDNGHLLIDIQDQGPGITAYDQEKIFNRFFRVDPSRVKSTTSGFGLGLALAKEIAAAHHTKIEVHSTPGQGSTFRVYLPLKSGSSEA